MAKRKKQKLSPFEFGIGMQEAMRRAESWTKREILSYHELEARVTVEEFNEAELFQYLWDGIRITPVEIKEMKKFFKLKTLEEKRQYAIEDTLQFWKKMSLDQLRRNI